MKKHKSKQSPQSPGRGEMAGHSEKNSPPSKLAQGIMVFGLVALLSTAGYFGIDAYNRDVDTRAANATATVVARETENAPLPSFEDVSVGESLTYLSQQLDQNANLNNLDEYGNRNTLIFIGHAYNIYTQATGSDLSVDDMLKNTSFGGNQDMMNIDSRSTIAGPDPRFVGGKTYRDINGTEKIIFNRDYLFYNKAEIIKYSSEENLPKTVLGNILPVILHEPFHYESSFRELQPRVFITGSGRQWEYTKSFGLALTGTLIGDAQKTVVKHFDAFDEISIYHMQSTFEKNTLGDLYHDYQPQRYSEYSDIFSELLMKYGYASPESIFELRKGGGILEVIDKVASSIPDDKVVPGIAKQNMAYQFLVTVDRKIYENASPEEIRGFIATWLGSYTNGQ